MENRRSKIIKLYDVKNRDWMLYKVTKKNFITVHHICERANGGKNIIQNFAPLTRLAHFNLNCMQSNNPNLYNEYQDLFREIAITGGPPTEEHVARMRVLKIKAKECGYDEK